MQEQQFEAVRLDEWQYCLHCRRVGRSMDWRRVPGQEKCPYRECHSSFYGGSCTYHSVRQCYPDLPETPQLGVVYAKNTVLLLISGYV